MVCLRWILFTLLYSPNKTCLRSLWFQKKALTPRFPVCVWGKQTYHILLNTPNYSFKQLMVLISHEPALLCVFFDVYYQYTIYQKRPANATVSKQRWMTMVMPFMVYELQTDETFLHTAFLYQTLAHTAELLRHVLKQLHFNVICECTCSMTDKMTEGATHCVLTDMNKHKRINVIFPDIICTTCVSLTLAQGIE